MARLSVARSARRAHACHLSCPQRRHRTLLAGRFGNLHQSIFLHPTGASRASTRGRVAPACGSWRGRAFHTRFHTRNHARIRHVGCAEVTASTQTSRMSGALAPWPSTLLIMPPSLTIYVRSKHACRALRDCGDTVSRMSDAIRRRGPHTPSPQLHMRFDSSVRHMRVVRVLSTVLGPEGPRLPTPAYACVFTL